MIKTNTEYIKCECCGRTKQINVERVITCDSCGKEIDGLDDYLYCAAFFTDWDHEKPVPSFEYCCWDCYFVGLTTINCNDFIDQPHILCDSDNKNVNLAGFIEAAAKFSHKVTDNEQ